MSYDNATCRNTQHTPQLRLPARTPNTHLSFVCLPLADILAAGLVQLLGAPLEEARRGAWAQVRATPPINFTTANVREPTHDEYDSDRFKWLLFDCRGDGKGWGKGKGGKGKGGKGKGKGKW